MNVSELLSFLGDARVELGGHNFVGSVIPGLCEAASAEVLPDGSAKLTNESP